MTEYNAELAKLKEISRKNSIPRKSILKHNGNYTTNIKFGGTRYTLSVLAILPCLHYAYTTAVLLKKKICLHISTSM